MHLGNGLISPGCAIATFAIATAAVASAAVSVARDRARRPTADRVDGWRLAVATTFVFVMQTINLPVGAGVSGHLIGGALLAYWFGAAWGAIAMTVVLVVQSVLLADGGLAALGANVLNMAVVPCLVVYPLVARLVSHPLVRLAVAAGVSVPAAAGACGLEMLTLAPARANAGELLAALLGVHLAIAGIEILLSLAAALAAARSNRHLPHPRSLAWATATAALLAGGLLIEGSPWPDGLEFSLARFGLEAPTGLLDAAQARLAAAVDASGLGTAIGGVCAAVLAGALSVAARGRRTRHV